MTPQCVHHLIQSRTQTIILKVGFASTSAIKTLCNQLIRRVVTCNVSREYIASRNKQIPLSLFLRCNTASPTLQRRAQAIAEQTRSGTVTAQTLVRSTIKILGQNDSGYTWHEHAWHAHTYAHTTSCMQPESWACMTWTNVFVPNSVNIGFQREPTIALTTNQLFS